MKKNLLSKLRLSMRICIVLSLLFCWGDAHTQLTEKLAESKKEDNAKGGTQGFKANRIAKNYNRLVSNEVASLGHEALSDLNGYAILKAKAIKKYIDMLTSGDVSDSDKLDALNYIIDLFVNETVEVEVEKGRTLKIDKFFEKIKNEATLGKKTKWVEIFERGEEFNKLGVKYVRIKEDCYELQNTTYSINKNVEVVLVYEGEVKKSKVAVKISGLKII